MFYIHRNKIVVASLLMFMTIGALAQETNPLYDRKPVRFGFALMGNTSKTKFTVTDNNLNYDSLQVIETVSFPGFGLGGVVNFRLADYWDVRTMLNIQFATRNMNYHFKSNNTKTAEMEATFLELPLTFEYKSRRHKNVRMYVLGGFTYRYDFTSDADTDRSDTKPIVAFKPSTFSYDLGVGLDIYYDFFKFSPEIKLSNGIGNQLVPDDFVYAKSLGRLSTKMVQFSLIFQ